MHGMVLAISVFMVASASAIAAPATALTSSTQPPSAKEQRPDASVRIAQACGWYAIFSCTRSRRSAWRFSDNHDIGYVINTGDSDYPNFRRGYYCVVEGPMSRKRAQRQARRARRDFAPTAYVKNAC